MRPNVARRRITFEGGNDGIAGSRFFSIRYEPRICLASLLRTVVDFAGQAIFIGAMLTIASILPTDRSIVVNVYVPVIALLAVPWAVHALQIPIGMAILAVQVLFMLWLFAGPLSVASAPEAKLLVVLGAIMMSPWLLAFATSETGRSLRWATSAGVIVALAISTQAAIGTPHKVELLHFATSGILILLFVLLLRSYAERLAASPDVPVQAAVSLTFLSYWLLPGCHETRAVHLRWTVCLIASVLGILSTHASLAVWLDGDALHPPLLRLAIAGPPVLTCLALRCSPVLYVKRVLCGLTESLVLWMTDEHVTPHGPGIVTALRFDIYGFPVRRSMMFALIFIMTCALIMQRHGLGLEHFQFVARQGRWIDVILQATLLPLEAVISAMIYLFWICGPCLAYFADLHRRANDDAA